MSEIINDIEEVISDDKWDYEHSNTKRAKTCTGKKNKNRKKKLAGCFEELEEFNRIIMQKSTRESGKEYIRVFYGNTRSLNKQKEEVLRVLALREDADVQASSKEVRSN